MTIGIGKKEDPTSRSITCSIRRRQASGARVETLDTREYDICKRIAVRITSVMTLMSSASGQLTSASTINALKGSFDESVISEHIESHHGLAMAVSAVLGSLHTLSEQTYENKALVFGCLLDPSKSSTNGIQFPEPFLGAKKYKALSDGFKTAYHVATNGAVMDFVELQRMSAPDLSERNFYPDWTEPMARVSRKGNAVLP